MPSVVEILETAMSHHRQGDLGRAEKIYREIVRVDPAHPDALHLLGVTAHQKNDNESALGLIRRAICVNPHAATYHCNLGVVFRALGQPEQAVDCYREAIRLASDYAAAHNNLGHALQSLGRLDEAVTCFRRALELKPDYADAELNLGNALRDLGNLDETMARYEQAVSLNPNDAETRFSRALGMLLLGDLERGFREYEWRWKCQVPRSPFSLPAWDGSDLTGKTLLIIGEQGIGDEIMFASCVPDCIERAGRVVILCEPRLVPLFSRSFPTAGVFAQMAKSPANSQTLSGEPGVQIASGSLPRFFRTSLALFPRNQSYLTADAATVSNFRTRLAELGNGLKIGISWKGGEEASVRRQRSTALDRWTRLLGIPGAVFVNLQYGPCSGELAAIKQNSGVEIHDWPDVDPLRDLDRFAAQIAALDLVISVDNSTVHLAGAVGVPTWVLLSATPNWRWMLDRPDSPWYPSVRLFRQLQPGEWQPVFEQLSRALQMLFDAGEPTGKQTTTRADPLTDTERERDKYERIWTSAEYRQISPGLDNLDKIQLIDHLRRYDVRTILDAGCGSGKLMQKLITDYRDEFEVRGFDISANCLDPFFDDLGDDILTVGCLWDENDFRFAKPFDAVICTDVLEHIPTEHIPQVLRNLARWTRKVCYLAIALFPDGFGRKLLGEPLHLTVKQPGWWFEQFTSAGLQLQAEGVERNAAGREMWLHAFLRPGGDSGVVG